jgi:hypothetical protein
LHGIIDDRLDLNANLTQSMHNAFIKLQIFGFFFINYLFIIWDIYRPINKNKSYKCEIKVDYKLVVGITCKCIYVACSHWLMGKYLIDNFVL